jgi:LPXTG-motif cell wall-anchored protein
MASEQSVVLGDENLGNVNSGEEKQVQENVGQTDSGEENQGQVVDQADQKLECSGQENPGQENPGQENPGQENPGQENPGQENPGQENPGQENPGQENPGQENPGQENPGQENPGQENPGQENPDQENPDQENPGQENPGQENPGQENPSQECSGQDDSWKDLDNKTVFYVLKEGQAIPSTLELGAVLKYYNGIIFDQVYDGQGNIKYYGDPAVFLNGEDISAFFGENFLVPTIKQLESVGVVMNEGDKIVWYSLKREQNTWHVDGIKVSCPPVTPTPTETPSPTVSPSPTVVPTTPPSPPSQEYTNPVPVVPEVTVSPTPTVTPVVEEPAAVEPIIEEPDTQEPVEEEPVVEEVVDTETEDVVDDPVPEALPQTGTSNPISFYFMGGVLIIAGVFVVASRKKTGYVL